jgi:uncharacterized membrane protein required for colicin V production
MEGQWTFLDLIFVVIILISTVLALTKGLMREIISLVSLVASLCLLQRPKTSPTCLAS